MTDYQLISSGGGRKLEKFGPYFIDRPSLAAVWKLEKGFCRPDAAFTRDPNGEWTLNSKIPESWTVEVEGIRFKLSLTDFGHLGIFPEQRPSWRWLREVISQAPKPIRVLNLFAYSGGATLAAAQGGAQVTHLDASKKMVNWAKENAELNQLDGIRWIVDDVRKFLTRELKRGNRYDGIILDPPSFGRGAKGEVFKIENDLLGILDLCKDLLIEEPLFLLMTCHSPGFSPLVLRHLVSGILPGREIEYGEMMLEGVEGTLPVPSGCFARAY